MKVLRRHIPILLIYAIGINLYFCLWYLGSEGSALDWSYASLNFYHLWVNANISALLLFLAFAALKTYTLGRPQFGIRSRRLKTLSEWLVGGLLFLSCVLIANRLSSSVSAAWGYSQTTGFLSLSIYHFAIFLIIVAMANLSERLGGLGRIANYLFKTYTTPKEVSRGFMFIDLNDSTRIGERLSNEAYSDFIRQCFRQLDQVIAGYDGIELYQYVGDEAILHWDFDDEERCAWAIELFQDYRQMLRDQSTHFQAVFGLQPTFKAAIHGGLVVHSELGREVIHTAFHGDVLNTTSRIMGLCKKHNTDLLISRTYFDRLTPKNLSNAYQKIDDVVLNGKTHKLTVYKPIAWDTKDTTLNLFMNLK